MEIASSDGTTIWVEVTGPDDAPPIVLAHGIVASARAWDWLVPSLADRYRVIVPDVRGHGRSGRAPGRYRLAANVADLAAVIARIADGPVVAVGHSLGGVTTYVLGQQRPELLRAVLLEDPAIRDLAHLPAGEPTLDGALLTMFRLIARAAPRVQASGITADNLAPLLASGATAFGVRADERYHQDAFRAWASAQLTLDVAVLDGVLGSDPADHDLDLDAPMTVPGIVLAADLAAPDGVLTDAVATRLAAASPALTIERLAGAGHSLHDELDHRDTFVTRLESLLARHAPV